MKQDLKSLVREFLKEIEHVPMRAVDCDQEKVRELIKKLEEAVA
jgi:hypothetical protein